jgi:hypothetical protein
LLGSQVFEERQPAARELLEIIEIRELTCRPLPFLYAESEFGCRARGTFYSPVERKISMNPKNEKRNTMNNHCQPARLAVFAVLLLATVGSLVTVSAAANANTPITVAQLAGPWQFAIVGNTGCGVSSLLFTGTLNASGTAVGTLTGASGGCAPSTSTQTFTILSLNANGSGTAALSCGTGCGWNFDIQVAINRQIFNLVDVVNGGANVLAGTAVKQ